MTAQAVWTPASNPDSRISWAVQNINMSCIFEIMTMTGVDFLDEPRLMQRRPFHQGRLQSAQNKGTMIPAMIRPFQTKLSHFAECQHKFADIFFPLLSLAALLFIYIIPVTLRLITPLWFAYLWLKLRTDVHTVNTVRQKQTGPMWSWRDEGMSVEYS